MKRLISALIGLTFALTAVQALAGAWGQEQGKGLLVNNFTYYQAETFWDKSGKLRDSGGQFVKREINPYFEYGVYKGWTVSFNGYYHFLTQTARNSGRQWDANGVQDLEFGVQRQIYNEGGFASAVKGTLIVPTGYGLGTIPPLGYDRLGAQGDLLLGYGWQALNGRNFFVDLQAGYRAYQDYPSPQVRSLLTFGADLNKIFQLLVQGEIQYGLDNQARKQADTIALSAYYRLLKQTTQIRVRLDDKHSFAVGYAWHVWGENTGTGGGPVASYWYAF